MQRIALVADMLQVVVELHLSGEEEPDDDDETQPNDDERVAVVGVVVDALNALEYLLVMLLILLAQEVRQEDEGEEGVADEGEGGKEAEVLEQVALREEQPEERADGGEAAEAYRHGLLLEHLLHVAHKALVDNDMQAVAECDAQNHGADAEGHQRHSALDPVHAGQGEEGAVGHGQHVLPDDVGAFEADTQHDKDD